MPFMQLVSNLYRFKRIVHEFLTKFAIAVSLSQNGKEERESHEYLNYKQAAKFNPADPYRCIRRVQLHRAS